MGKQAVGWVRGSTEPADDSEQIRFRHYGAPEAGAVRGAAEMKKNGAAGAWDWRIGIVADFDEPAVSGVAEAHALFFEPCWWNGVCREADMAIVLWEAGIIDPCIAFGDRDEWIIGSSGKRGVGGIDGAEEKNACRSTAVFFHFSSTGLVLTEQSVSPCESIFSEEDRCRNAYGFPSAG